MPKISVVVPIYNVEAYLGACLDSIARQTAGDLECIMVDDGGTDSSAAIAAAYAEGDPRFKLVSQANRGLSGARNTGTRHATGEYLAFVDSDDVLPPDAYELLLGALEQTGSDFATGNVQRLTRWGTSQANFLSRTFARTELATHVTRFRPLLADRIAWNKLFRRSFWDAQGYEFPEGRIHEDIPVIIPAQFAATSVDVISEPVYYWRIREDGDLSITQRRLELKALNDRMQALEEVSAYLEAQGPRGARRWYEESVVADDLRLHLNILDRASDEYRRLFLDRVNAYLDGASPRIYRRLPAIERLKWHLVRRRLMPELLEVLRFQKEDLASTPPVRVRRRWYGDYPFRDDARLKVPRSVYRLVNADLPGAVHLDELRAGDDGLVIRGFGYITGIGAPRPGSQKVSVVALQAGRLRRVRLYLAPLRLRTAPVRRPDATARSGQALTDLEWSGFEARLDPAELTRKAGDEDARWELYVTLAAGGIRRRRVRFALDRALRAVELPAGADALARAVPTEAGGVELELRRAWAAVDGVERQGDGAATLAGSIRPEAPQKAKLELRRQADGAARRVPLRAAGSGRFTARVALDELRAAGPPPDDDIRPDSGEGVLWELTVALGGGRRVPVLLPAVLAGTVLRRDGTELAVTRTRRGDAALAERTPRAVVESAAWDAAGGLELAGTLPVTGEAAIVLRLNDGVEEHLVPVRPADARFAVTLTPAAVTSMRGTLPLREGTWRLVLRAAGLTDAPMAVAPALEADGPSQHAVAHKSFTFSPSGPDGGAAIMVERDLDDVELGPFHQRRLRAATAAQPERRLRDAVVYISFGGRQYSDNPRAIHEELVRRGTALEHLWVVRDGACAVPGSATVLRKGSREYHEALATARYIVTNDALPAWFRRAEDQVVVQTLHGHPLRKQGFDIAARRGGARRLFKGLDEQVANWSYLLSPGGRSSELLRGAYGVEDALVETGLPRTDLLAEPGRAARRAAVRTALDLPEGAQAVLYAPTYRDDAVDRRGRFRLDLQVDLARLRDAAGTDAVVLFRKHPFIVDSLPQAGDRILDVSSYPDGTEVLLAADGLVTDYSSMLVDFAPTGLPLLCFGYDLERYEEVVRGFYMPFAQAVPAPLLRTEDELADALADPTRACAPFGDRRREFAATYCPLDDGAAAARAVDSIFGPDPSAPVPHGAAARSRPS
jgi:CDP-glycerol glycerophosphotransferase